MRGYDLRYMPGVDFEVHDFEEGVTLKKMDIIKRMNRQNMLIKHKDRHIDALINALNEEIENADGEVKAALIRIANKELDI